MREILSLLQTKHIPLRDKDFHALDAEDPAPPQSSKPSQPTESEIKSDEQNKETEMKDEQIKDIESNKQESSDKMQDDTKLELGKKISFGLVYPDRTGKFVVKPVRSLRIIILIFLICF